MSKRVVYQVMPTSDGDWKVKKTGGQRASAVEQNKQVAVDRASELAKRSPLAQVVIRKLDGSIQKEYTYGKDPRRRKG